MTLSQAPLRHLAERLAARQMSATELAQACWARVEANEPSVHAFASMRKEASLAQAAACDRQLADRAFLPPSPLFGLPIAIKDNMCVSGWEVTCSSRILKGYVAPYDATVVARLKAAGAVLMGTCNMDEFAMGSSTENSAFGPSKNPWDASRVPGGSSGGSAAAVSAGFCTAALGSDTGGSIRQPAAFCHLVGLKPTYGRVSRYGLIAFASSLDQIGPLARTVEDAALVYDAIAGHDAMDSTSWPNTPEPIAPRLGRRESLKGLRVGIPKEYFVEGLDAEVRDTVRRAIGDLEALGAVTRDISLPHTEYGLATYYLIAPAEASSNLARYDGVLYGARDASAPSYGEMALATRGKGFGPEVKRRLLIGTYVLSAGYYDAYYARALKVRTLIKRDFEEAFGQVDVIVGPSTPTPPFAFGDRAQDPLQMYLSDVLTIPTSLAGLPGVAIPAGFTASGLPVGMQIIGPALKEREIMETAHVYERAKKWVDHQPPLK